MRCIYKITNPKGAIYIGQTINFKNRLLFYKSKHCKSQRKLYNSFNKYDFNDHVFEVIEECKRKDLNVRERYWQEFYNCTDSKTGLNCMLVEVNDKPRILSAESRKKMSDAKIGKKLSKETVAKIIESNRLTKLNPSYIRKAFSRETLEKMTQANKNNPTRFKNLSLGRNKGYPIIQMDKEGNFIKEWANNEIAGKTLKIERASITRCMQGKFKHAGGFTWKPKFKEHINNTKNIFI